MIASDVVTFTSNDRTCTYVVRKGFTGICPSYLEESPYCLNVEYGISSYLHNEYGPALITHCNGAEYFFSNGVEIKDPEKIRRMVHNASFNDEMNTIIGD